MDAMPSKVIMSYSHPYSLSPLAGLQTLRLFCHFNMNMHVLQKEMLNTIRFGHGQIPCLMTNSANFR